MDPKVDNCIVSPNKTSSTYNSTKSRKLKLYWVRKSRQQNICSHCLQLQLHYMWKISDDFSLSCVSENIPLYVALCYLT